jgi:hypothetical protein
VSQVTQTLQASEMGAEAESLPSEPQWRRQTELPGLSWLAEARNGSVVEVCNPLNVEVALGRGTLCGLRNMGARLAVPAVAVVTNLQWYGGQDAVRLVPGLDLLPLSGEVMFPVGTYVLRSLQATSR